jgi:hypothetical protein
MGWPLAIIYGITLLASAAATLYSTKKSIKEQKKARDDEKDRLAAEEKKAQGVQRRIENEELERKRRLRAAGTEKPQTLLGGYQGLPQRKARKATLG